MMQARIKEHHFGCRLITTVEAGAPRVLVVVTTAYCGKSYPGNSAEDPGSLILSASDCAEERSRESSSNNAINASVLSEEAEGLKRSINNSIRSTRSPNRVVEAFDEEHFKCEG